MCDLHVQQRGKRRRPLSAAAPAAWTLLASATAGVGADAQEARTLKPVLDSIDFSAPAVSVTPDGKLGMLVPKGFKVVSVAGCTVKLRGEHTYPEGTAVSDLTIPLADLEPEAEITNPLVSLGATVPDYPNWWAVFKTRRSRRAVVLVGRADRRRVVRWHTLEFGFGDRAGAEKFAESLKPAVRMCAGRGSDKLNHE